MLRRVPLVALLLMAAVLPAAVWGEPLPTELRLTANASRTGIPVARFENGTLVPPAFSAAFTPASVPAGSPSRLTFTIDNASSPDPATNLAFENSLPAGIVIAASPGVTNLCSGTVSAVAGSGSFSLSGGTVAGQGVCSVSVEVVPSAVGTFNNVSGSLTSSLGNSGDASASLTVTPGVFALSSATPAPGAVSAAPSTNVSASFNAALDPGTASAATFTVRGSQTGDRAGTLSFPTASSLAFDPALDFLPGEVVSVTATSGLQTSAGEALAPYTWEFLSSPARGPGAFGTGTTVATITADALVPADLDGDGDLDVVAGSISPEGVHWFEQENGAFTQHQIWSSSGGTDFFPFAVADLNGDGFLDVVTVDRRTDRVLWFEHDGNPDPTFTERLVGVSASFVFSTLVADFDGDGDLDVVTPTGFSGDLKVFKNDGAGVFTSTNGPSAGTRTISADVDGDGDLDLLASSFRDPVIWLANDGSGNFANATVIAPAGDSVSLVAAGDLNSDGTTDVVIVRYNGAQKIRWYPGIGGGAFGAARNVSTEALTVSGLHLSDIDGDGDLDLSIAQRDGTDRWFANDGTGAFDAPETVAASTVGRGVASADINGDGVLDLLFSSGGRITWYEQSSPSLTAQADGDAGWRMLSAPTGSTVGGLLSPTWTQGFPDADTEAGRPNVYFYAEPVPGDADLGYRAPTTQSEALPRGTGVFAYLFDDDDATTPEIDGGFPKVFSVPGPAPSMAPFAWGAGGDAPLSYTDTGGLAEDDGWNLLGNPYAVPLDWDDVVRTDVDGAVYVYDDATSQYLSYAGGAGSLTDGIIEPFSGFWAQATDASPSLVAMPAAPARADAPEPLVVGLRLVPGENSAVPATAASDALVVVGTDGATPGWDTIDAYALTSLAADHVQLATLVADGSSALGLSVDHRPARDERTEIDLEVRAVAGGEATGGALVLTWPSFDASALPDGTHVRLLDRETGDEVDLAAAANYRFDLDAPSPRVTTPAVGTGSPSALRPPTPLRLEAAAVGGGATRLALIVETYAATASENAPEIAPLGTPHPNPTPDATTLCVAVKHPERVRITVIDATGREVTTVLDRVITGTEDVVINTAHLPVGTYLVRAQAASFTSVRRFTVIR